MSEPGEHAHTAPLASAFAAARNWLERDGSVVMATVIETWGSAPVPVGGQMVIADDGTFHGSVSGGCVEGEVIAAAEDVAQTGQPETVVFGVADETAWSVGLPCGGQIRVYLEHLTTTGGDLAILEQAGAAQASRDAIVIATDIETGAKTVHTRTSPSVPETVEKQFKTAKSDLVEGESGAVFYHAVVPPARVVVIGATHIAQLFCKMAKLAGYDVVVVDPRTAFASPERFDGVTLLAQWPQDALPSLGLDDYTALVVVAHVSHIDDEALKIALNSDCHYIGALGSRRNHEKRTARLKDTGFTDADLARIKCPIGLDIGAQSPAEIAVGVLAEVILAVRGQKHPDRALTAGHDL